MTTTYEVTTSHFSMVTWIGCPSYHKWLSFPLMNLIDYQGFRLTAQAVLPIDSSTLVYGSDDGGKHVVVSDYEVNVKMEDLAKRLNLRYHTGGIHSTSAKNICFPTDIEVHKGRDGRVYMIDFARAFSLLTKLRLSRYLSSDPKLRIQYFYLSHTTFSPRVLGELQARLIRRCLL